MVPEAAGRRDRGAALGHARQVTRRRNWRIIQLSRADRYRYYSPLSGDCICIINTTVRCAYNQHAKMHNLQINLTHSPNRVVCSEGWRPPGAQVNRVNSRNDYVMMTAHFFSFFHHLLSAQCVSSIGQIIKSVCVCQ